MLFINKPNYSIFTLTIAMQHVASSYSTTIRCILNREPGIGNQESGIGNQEL